MMIDTVVNVVCVLTAAVVCVATGGLMHLLLVRVNSVPIPAELADRRLPIVLARVTAFMTLGLPLMAAFIASAVWGMRAFVDILRGGL